MPSEEINILEGEGRFLAEDVFCPEDLPPFDKALKDGFALSSELTDTAHKESPIKLKIKGEILMGFRGKESIEKGETLYVPTGAPLPSGTDTILPEEQALKKGKYIIINRYLSSGENILLKGALKKRGELLFKAGIRLTLPKIALLLGFGKKRVKVRKRPKIFVISTGNELISFYEENSKLGIKDINGPCLFWAIKKMGADPIGLQIVRDDVQVLYNLLRQALDLADIILLSGGTGKGKKDIVYKVLKKLLKGHVQRWGKRLSWGKIKSKLIFSLPGPSGKCLLLFYLWITPVIRYMQGARKLFPFVWLPGRLRQDVIISSGNFIPVNIIRDKKENIWVSPLPQKDLLLGLAYSDGVIFCNQKKINKGEIVQVLLLPF